MFSFFTVTFSLLFLFYFDDWSIFYFTLVESKLEQISAVYNCISSCLIIKSSKGIQVNPFYKSRFITFFRLHKCLNFLAIDQLNAQILVLIISLLYSSTCFEHYFVHHQEVKLYYTASRIVTLGRWPSGAQADSGLESTVSLLIANFLYSLLKLPSERLESGLLNVRIRQRYTWIARRTAIVSVTFIQVIYTRNILQNS